MNIRQKKVYYLYFKSVLMLIVTMGLGMLVATALGKVLLKKEVVAETPVDPASLQEVYVLKQKHAQGQEIVADDVIIDHFVKNKVPRGSVRSFSQIMNRPLKKEVAAGTILLEDDFAIKIDRDKIKGFVPSGHQLVAIQIQESADEKNKNIVPGDHVDVLLVQETDGKDAVSETVLFEKIPVMDAIWENVADRENRVKGTISLLLSDEQKEDILKESGEKAKLRLRVCPPVNPPNENPMVNPLENNFVQDSADTKIVASAQPKESVPEQQPAVLSTMLPNSTGEIYTVFHGEKLANSKLAQNKNSNIKPTPAVPGAKYGEATQMTQLAYPQQADNGLSKGMLTGGTAEANAPYQLDDRTAPRYSSFYGENRPSQWHETVPRRPLVYNAPTPDSSQQHGIYRSNGVYLTNGQ